MPLNSLMLQTIPLQHIVCVTPDGHSNVKTHDVSKKKHFAIIIMIVLISLMSLQDVHQIWT